MKAEAKKAVAFVLLETAIVSAVFVAGLLATPWLRKIKAAKTPTPALPPDQSTA
ncbi:hypothetical protein [uncultured Thiodictyon sp.]|uniref:hypothetical protein n=1 Tax=uncultured Thiodictyon sp. TaxID=1846217 RepID=UPI0025DD3916|nr:hypothetical protein [uncultured Thiodictyon sp.]